MVAKQEKASASAARMAGSWVGKCFVTNLRNWLVSILLLLYHYCYIYHELLQHSNNVYFAPEQKSWEVNFPISVPYRGELSHGQREAAKGIAAIF